MTDNERDVVLPPTAVPARPTDAVLWQRTVAAVALIRAQRVAHWRQT